jgi:hypothetical protein
LKHFITRAVYFLLAFCLTQVACNHFLLKGRKLPYEHNGQFTTQYHHYLSKADQYNTVFMGSSRTYRQINPQLIDQGLADLQIKSYNLGAHATFIPEAFYLLEMFIDSQPRETPVRYVFMELTGINNIKMVNWFSPQSYYYLDMDLLKLVWNTHFNTPGLPGWTAWIYTYPYLQGYVLKQIMPLSLMKTYVEADNYSGERGDGYYPLDIDLQQNQSEKLIKRRNEFLKDTMVLLERKGKQMHRKKEDISQAYTDYLNYLIDKAEQKNIKLYYIIPPKLKYYQSLASLQDQVKDQRVIDMGSYEPYPQLNFARYNFDDGHFNSTGAQLYSTYLVQHIRERLAIDKNTFPQTPE